MYVCIMYESVVVLLCVFVEGSDKVARTRVDRPQLLVNLLGHLQCMNTCMHCQVSFPSPAYMLVCM